MSRSPRLMLVNSQILQKSPLPRTKHPGNLGLFRPESASMHSNLEPSSLNPKP